ncbi:MAG: hypothetical protein ABI812_01585 [Betaproteobacteria bacterium]
MKLTLIVPGLNACSAAALAATPALKRLAVFAKAPAAVAGGLDAATIEALGLAADTPQAPLRALGAGLAAGDDYVLAADPVALVAGGDDVVLDAQIADLAADEAAALLAALNAHFAQDGLGFAAPRPDAWFVCMTATPQLLTTPLHRAAGAPIFDHLPGGADGKTWQRWQNEIQMLLHTHPANGAREARGVRAVTGLWFWGGGRLRDIPTRAGPLVVAAAGAAGDLARGYAKHVGRTDDRLPATIAPILANAPATTAAVVALPVVDGDASLAALADGWIAPAVAALARGGIETLDLLVDGGGVTTRWRALRPSRFARLTARWRGSRFVVPSFDV